jgi:hypothetical protein
MSKYCQPDQQTDPNQLNDKTKIIKVHVSRNLETRRQEEGRARKLSLLLYHCNPYRKRQLKDKIETTEGTVWITL